jgi:phosphate transport system substrate-binding protein
MRIVKWGILALAILASLPASAEGTSEGAEELALRKNLLVVGTPVVRPSIEASTRYFVSRRQMAQPMVELIPPASVFAKFCSGIGIEFPDVAVAHRRISRNEFRLCGEHGVSEIIEVAAGSEALILAARKGITPFNLSAEHLYRALALEIPREGVFYTNRTRAWREIDPQLPDTEIVFALPSEDFGLHYLFADRAMEGGCRGIAEIRNIHGAAERVRKCAALREDQRLYKAARAEALSMFLERAPQGAIAALPRQLYEQLGSGVAAFPFEGVLPTQKSIEAGDYQLSRRIYFYFKVKHMHDKKGYGVTRGLREYLLDVTSEQASDPGGYFESAGLTLLAPAERARQRLESLLLRPMSR